MKDSGTKTKTNQNRQIAKPCAKQANNSVGKQYDGDDDDLRDEGLVTTLSEVDSNGWHDNRGGRLDEASATNNNIISDSNSNAWANPSTDRLHRETSLSLARPGAVRVAGNAVDANRQFSFTETASNGDDYVLDSNNLPFDAVLVDDVEALYRQRFEDEMRQQVLMEMAQNNSRKNDSRWRRLQNIAPFLLVALVLVATLVAALVLLLKGSIKTEDQKESEKLFNFLLPFIGNELLNTSSHRYQAFEWLAHEDPMRLTVDYASEYDLLQRYIIVLFYFATDGPNWALDGNVLSNLSVCEWYGFLCYKGRSMVYKISHAGNKLHGTLPPELSNLVYLEEIDLWENKLWGTIPTSILTLPRLEKFELGRSSCTGPLVASFSPRLRYFGVARNKLTGTIPYGLTSLPSLQWLDMRGNMLTGTLPEFAFPQGLCVVAITGNMLHGSLPVSLLSAQGLEYATLDQNLFTGSISESLGTKIENMVLSSNLLTGTIPTEIGRLERLFMLSLDDNMLSGTIPTEAGKIFYIQYVKLDWNKLSGTIPSELGLIGNLRKLSASNNELSGTVPDSLSHLPKLVELKLGNNSITGGLDAAFCNASSSSMQIIQSDCGGDNPKVNCPCCASCCDRSGVCNNRPETLCARYKQMLHTESNHCTCSTTSDEISCMDTCQYCSVDGGYCYKDESPGYGYTLDGLKVTSVFFNVKFVTGTDWDVRLRVTENFGCNVHINGQECKYCRFIMCKDGHRTNMIDCTNVDGVGDLGLRSGCISNTGPLSVVVEQLERLMRWERWADGDDFHHRQQKECHNLK